MVKVSAASVVVAGDVLNWYQSKIGQIRGLIQPTLMLVALFFVVVSYVMFRSWKKAVVAGIGGAIVVAVVANIAGLSQEFKSELGGLPAPVSSVTRVL